MGHGNPDMIRSLALSLAVLSGPAPLDPCAPLLPEPAPAFAGPDCGTGLPAPAGRKEPRAGGATRG